MIKILANESILFLIFLFVLSQIVTAGEVYKWTDKNGAIYFSDIPPPNTGKAKNKKNDIINVPNIEINENEQKRIEKELKSIELENEKWWRNYERTEEEENRKKTKKEIKILKEKLRKKKVELEKELSRLEGWEAYQAQSSNRFKSYYPKKRKKIFLKMEEERKKIMGNMTKNQKNSISETKKLEEEIRIITIGIDYTKSITPPPHPTGTIQP